MAADNDRDLTDRAFWDSFWDDLDIPDVIDASNSFDRAFVQVLDRHLTGMAGGRLAEIGCAPGRWLIHCNQHFGFDVTGFDSSPEGMAKTRENLAYNGVEAQLITDDIMAYPGGAAGFDVVMSMGLIEHFRAPDAIVDRHIKLVKPGGLLILEVPNLRGLTLKLLRSTNSSLLDHHNLDVMDRAVLERLGTVAGLEVLEARYIAGFEPQYVDASRKGPVFRTAFGVAAAAQRRLRGLDRINAPWLSGYLVAVFRKPV